MISDIWSRGDKAYPSVLCNSFNGIFEKSLSGTYVFGIVCLLKVFSEKE